VGGMPLVVGLYDADGRLVDSRVRGAGPSGGA